MFGLFKKKEPATTTNHTVEVLETADLNDVVRVESYPIPSTEAALARHLHRIERVYQALDKADISDQQRVAFLEEVEKRVNVLRVNYPQIKNDRKVILKTIAKLESSRGRV